VVLEDVTLGIDAGGSLAAPPTHRVARASSSLALLADTSTQERLLAVSAGKRA